MKSKGKKTGFTIIELLTVMSIIIILIGILVPSLNAVKRYTRDVAQKSLFYEISKGLENYEKDEDHKDLPDSFWEDLDGHDYCGAMKLCEAMVGQDGLGFHTDSVFDDMGKPTDKAADDLYYNRTPLIGPPYTDEEEENLRKRELWIEGENVQIAYMNELFPAQTTFDPCCAVLCDVFKRNQLRRADGTKLGMPILYYRADTSKLTHNIDFLRAQPDSGTNHYNYWDNSELIRINPPWAPGTDHPLSQPTATDPEGAVFYENTLNKDITTTEIPYNKDGYILISAGNDGLYGTGDDVYNFVK